MRWRSSKVKCSIPLEIAAHKTASVKGDRHLDSVLSAFILNTEGILIQVGSRKFIVTHFLAKVHALILNERGRKATYAQALQYPLFSCSPPPKEENGFEE